MAPTATLRPCLGAHLAQLACEERQAIAPCLLRQGIVPGEAVDSPCLLPFATTPQAARRRPQEPEGTPGHFYRLRLAHFHGVEVGPTMGGEELAAQLAVLVLPGRIELVRPL